MREPPPRATAGGSAQRGSSRGVPAPDPSAQMSVKEALALDAGAGVREVYVGWAFDPVCVASRRVGGRILTWDVAGVQLRARVVEAIKPLTDAGWELDGSPTTALRWDTSIGSNGQQYDGCWVRMRSRDA